MAWILISLNDIRHISYCVFLAVDVLINRGGVAEIFAWPVVLY
jgi:hypothetical protein